MYRGQRISVVIPCHNEEDGVRAVMAQMPSIVDEVLVVDNASTDRTTEVATSLGARVVYEGRKGYGRAYKTGFSEATGDIIVTMGELVNDEDMEFNTGNGRIQVTMPASFTGTIDASTGNGSIVSDFPITLTGRISRTRLRGTIGQGGGRRIRMTSGNGQIELRKG